MDPETLNYSKPTFSPIVHLEVAMLVAVHRAVPEGPAAIPVSATTIHAVPVVCIAEGKPLVLIYFRSSLHSRIQGEGGEARGTREAGEGKEIKNKLRETHLYDSPRDKPEVWQDYWVSISGEGR
jgi:hypothetical protein